MKRRSFLLGLIAAPAAPLLPKIAPAVASPCEWNLEAVMRDTLLAAAERAANPPLILGAVDGVTWIEADCLDVLDTRWETFDGKPIVMRKA